MHTKDNDSSPKSLIPNESKSSVDSQTPKTASNISRREFFKRARAILPALAVIGTGKGLTGCAEEIDIYEVGDSSCETCSGSCTRGCSTSCEAWCQDYCSGGCDTGCYTSCYTSCSDSATGSSGSSGSGGNSSSGESGTVQVTVYVDGPGYYYSNYAQSIDGDTYTTEWKKSSSSSTGYYVYGGAYDAHPEANQGRGVLHECNIGYNSIRIDSGFIYQGLDLGAQFYYVWIRFTLNP